MIVDHLPAERLKMNFDVTFHALRCSQCVLDAMDISGEHLEGVSEGVLRQRLDANGKPIFPPSTSHITAKNDQAGEGCRLTGFVEVKKVAGNVHIAVGGSRHNSHSEKHVHKFKLRQMKAFNASHTVHSFHFGELIPEELNLPLPPQYKSTIIARKGTTELREQLRSALLVSERSSPSVGLLSGTALTDLVSELHQRSLPEDETTSLMSMASQANLWEVVNTTPDKIGHFQYFFKVVPTTVRREGKEEQLHSHQYAVTTRVVEIDPAQPTQAEGLPGVFFIYDFSPFRTEITEKERHMGSLLTSICAVIGGVVFFIGIIDSAYYYLMKEVREHRRSRYEPVPLDPVLAEETSRQDTTNTFDSLGALGAQGNLGMHSLNDPLPEKMSFTSGRGLSPSQSHLSQLPQHGFPPSRGPLFQ